MKNLKERIKDFNQIRYREDQENAINNLKPDFVEYLKIVNPENEEDFATAIRIATAYYIQTTDLTYEFGVSQPTIERWVSGKNSPHPSMRPLVLEYIIEQVENQNKNKQR